MDNISFSLSRKAFKSGEMLFALFISNVSIVERTFESRYFSFIEFELGLLRGISHDEGSSQSSTGRYRVRIFGHKTERV